jgi:MFS family permease
MKLMPRRSKAEGAPSPDAVSTNGHGQATSGDRPAGLRRLLGEAAKYGEVRRTPYGLGISAGQIIGVLVTVGTVLIAFNLMVGWLADRHKRLPLVGWGAIISGLAAMGTSKVGSGTFPLGVARVTDEAADLGSQVPRYSLLADYYPPDVRGKAFALHTLMSRFGSVLAPLLAGGLILWIGWRTTFAVFGAGIVLMGIVILIRLREPLRGFMERQAVGLTDEVARIEDEPQSFGEAWRTTWAIRTLRRLFLADIFSGIGPSSPSSSSSSSPRSTSSTRCSAGSSSSRLPSPASSAITSAAAWWTCSPAATRVECSPSAARSKRWPPCRSSWWPSSRPSGCSWSCRPCSSSGSR